MSGFYGEGPLDAAATWVAAVVTLIVLGGLFGERRLFGWTQHLLAGLLTGFLALLAIREVVLPRLIDPLVAAGGLSAESWLGLVVVGLAAGAPWLPRVVSGIPVSLAVGALAAFALGGAVIGTVLPQLVAAATVDDDAPTVLAVGLASAAVSALVLVSFVHGVPRGRIGATAAVTGRWLLIAGIGGWLGWLLLSRLVLLVDRLAFLLGEWLGLGL